MTPLRNPPGALYTMVNGQRMFALTDWLMIGAAFCLGPCVVGGVLTFVFAGASGEMQWLPYAGTRLLYAPFMTIWVAPVVLAFFALLMRFGTAGWAVVLSASTLGVVVAAFSSPGGIAFAFFAVWLHTVCLWTAANHIEPDALSGRVNPS